MPQSQSKQKGRSSAPHTHEPRSALTANAAAPPSSETKGPPHEGLLARVFNTLFTRGVSLSSIGTCVNSR
jgi:hypothetical protein